MKTIKKFLNIAIFAACLFGAALATEAAATGTYSDESTGLYMYVSPSETMYLVNLSSPDRQSMNCWEEDENGADYELDNGMSLHYNRINDTYTYDGNVYTHTGGAGDASKTWRNSTYGLLLELETAESSGFTTLPGSVSGDYATIDGQVISNIHYDGQVVILGTKGWFINVNGIGYLHTWTTMGSTVYSGSCIKMY